MAVARADLVAGWGRPRVADLRQEGLLPLSLRRFAGGRG